MAIPPSGPKQEIFFEICTQAASNPSLAPRGVLEKKINTAYSEAEKEINQAMDSKAKDLSAIDKKVIGIIADGSKKLADIQAVYKQTNTILERSVGSEAVKRPPNIRIPREYDLDPSATPISNLQTIKNDFDSISRDFPTLTAKGVCPENYGDVTNLLKRCDEILRKIEKMPKERLSKEFINKSKPLLTMKTYLVTLISSYEYQLHDKPFL